MTTKSAAELRELGASLQDANDHLWQLYDELGADYASEAAKQFELQLKDADNPDRTYDSWWVQNDRQNIWHPTIGGKLPNDGENWSWVITSFTESVQPAVRQAADLLSKTRDTTETLATMTGEDMDALASIPTVLGLSMDALAKASESMEEAANRIGEIRNELNSSSWRGDGRDAYFESLKPQADAFKECQTNVEDTAEANTALAGITVDVMETFLSVRTEQLKLFGGLANTIFTLVNPGSWLDVAEKLHNQLNKAQQDHVKEFGTKLNQLAESAEKHRVVEKAERTVGMTWPAPFSGIDGNWGR